MNFRKCWLALEEQDDILLESYSSLMYEYFSLIFAMKKASKWVLTQGT